MKLLQFEGSCRPPFHGVVQEPSKLPNGRKPLIRLPWLDYDYDSEIEWVESEPGENISESASEDSDSLMDVECSSSSDEDSFLIDDERNANQNGLNAYFPLQEELVGITCCSDPNNTQHYILSKFPRKQISNVKIGNSTCLLLGSADGFPNKSGSILDDRSVQVSEMRENLKPLEEWWQIQEKSKDQLSRVDSSVTGM